MSPHRSATALAAVCACFLLAAAAPAAAQPVFTKTFLPDTIGPGSTAMLRFDIDNSGGVLPANDVAFSDTLPAGVVIAGAPGAFTTCGGGSSLSAPAGGGTISFSGGMVGAGSTCFVRVNVTSSTPGTHMNVSGTLTSSAGSSGSAAADLTVDIGLPGFSKSFSPSTVALGGRSTLTFLIDNSLNESSVPNLDFTDNLPPGMVIASPANASTTCGDPLIPPTLTATAGTSTITLDADGTTGFPAVAGMSTCMVTVDVIANAAGALGNVSDNLLAEGVEAGKAAATLTVTAAALAIEKTFTDDPVPPGGTVTVQFTIRNFSRGSSATGIGFSDDLDAVVSGLAPSGPLPATPCGGSSSLAFAMGTLTLTGGSLDPEGSCTFSVPLLVPDMTTPGAFGNTTTAVMGTVGGDAVTGNSASDVLFVSTVPILIKTFTDDPVGAGGTVTLEFTIINTSSTSSATDIAFTDDLNTAIPGLAANSLVAPGGLDPDPLVDPCGSGSELTIFDLNDTLPSPPFPNFPPDPTMLVFTGGSLAPAGSPGDTCTFSITVDVPAGTPEGTYTNTTGSITATVDGGTKTGNPAAGDLIVVGAPLLEKEFTDDPTVPGGAVTLELTLTHAAEASGDATGIAFSDDLTTLVPAVPGLTATSVDTNTCTGAVVDITTDPTLISVSGGTLMPGMACTITVMLAVPGGSSSGSFTNTTSAVTATVGGVATTGETAEDDLLIAGLLVTKEFTDDPAIPGGTVTLHFTLDNVSGSAGATSIAFDDDLGSALPGLTATAVSPPAPCGGTLTGIGTTMISFDGGSVAAGASCSFDVTLSVPATITNPSPPPATIPSDGNYLNTTSTVSFSGGTTTPAFDTLVVQSELLALSKEFTDDPTIPGGTVTLELTLENLDPNRSASAITFSDDLGAALAGLTVGSVLFDDCGGVPAGVGTDLFSYTGGSLAANDGSPGGADTCTIRLLLDVPAGPLPGDTFTNTTSDVTGTIAGLPVTGAPASDDLLVETLVLEKAFSGTAFPGETVDLTFTLTNLDASSGVSLLSFSDSLPAGLTAVAPLPTAPCGAGSTISGSSFLTFSGGSLGPSGSATDSCMFTLTLLVPSGAVPGSFLNTTSDVFSSGLSVAGPATDTLVIEPPPAFAKSFSPAAIGSGQTSTLTFTIDNSASTVAATGLAFTDNLPAAIVIATPPDAVNGCGGTLTAMAGGGTIALSGGAVGPGLTCTIEVDVTSATPGSHVNTTGDLTSSSGNSGTASDTLAVNPPPGFSKQFAPDVIAPGGTSVLTFTIDNTASSVAASGLDFTDVLPAGVVVASPSGAATDCTGGTLTAVAGSGTISYTGGTVAAMASCTVSVGVTSAAADTYSNTSGDLTSSLGNSGSASDDLAVVAGIASFTKAFLTSPVLPGGQVDLEFTITNTSPTFSLVDITFTDDVDAVIPGMVALGLPDANVCGTGSSLTGTSVITLTGGNLDPGESCTFAVTLQVPADADPGTYFNTTSPLTAETSGGAAVAVRANRLGEKAVITAPAATAPLVVAFLDFSKVFIPASVPSGGTTSLSFTITNPDPANAANGITFSDDLDAALAGMAAVGLPATGVCGPMSQISGTSVVTLTGGFLGPGASCTFAINISVPMVSSPATVTNVTSVLSATVNGLAVTGDPASAAAADLVVGANPLEIPTLGGWALLLLTGLLLAAGVWRLR